jgi:hypothetical protein
MSNENLKKGLAHKKSLDSKSGPAQAKGSANKVKRESGTAGKKNGKSFKYC